MAIGPAVFMYKYKDLSIEELEEKLAERKEYLKSNELKELRKKQIKLGIDDNNCITNVESQIIAIETLIKQKSKTEVINDINLIANKVVNRIQELPIGTEFSISELLEDYKCESKELFNITFEILKKLEELNIALGNSYGENAILGLPYNIKYVKIGSRTGKQEPFINEFLNKSIKSGKQSKIERKFEKYSKKFKAKFGREAYIAEPSGTMEQTIKAIKICLKENKDILDELLYPNK